LTEERKFLLGEEKVNKSLRILAVPAVVGMMINALYNVVDAMFVGWLGKEALAATGVAFPLLMLTGAVGLVFGVGGGAYVSRQLGKGNYERAQQAVSTAFFSTATVGAVITVPLLYYLTPILKCFGATQTVLPYALSYNRILTWGTAVTVMNICLNNTLRSEGGSRASMFGLGLGSVLNIVLDPILIFVFRMGIVGAAWATLISKVISLIYLLSFYVRGKSMVKLQIRRFSFSGRLYREMVKIGIPNFAQQVLVSVTMAMLNVGAAKYGGDAAVAAIAVIVRITSLIMLALFGINQGFMPLAGYSYGAGNIGRLKASLQLTLRTTTIISVAFTLCMILLPTALMRIFTGDAEVIRLGILGMQITCIAYPLFGYALTYCALFQALGRGIPALLLSLSRQGIFFIPAILILPKYFNLIGVLTAQPLADIMTIVLAFILAVPLNRELFIERQQDTQTI